MYYDYKAVEGWILLSDLRFSEEMSPT